MIYDEDVKFTFAFWKTIFVGLGTQVQFSIAYHPKLHGHIEWVNQILEDMLRMYVM